MCTTPEGAAYDRDALVSALRTILNDIEGGILGRDNNGSREHYDQ